jgi:hypothetical protein
VYCREERIWIAEHRHVKNANAPIALGITLSFFLYSHRARKRVGWTHLQSPLSQPLCIICECGVAQIMHEHQLGCSWKETLLSVSFMLSFERNALWCAKIKHVARDFINRLAVWGCSPRKRDSQSEWWMWIKCNISSTISLFCLLRIYVSIFWPRSLCK